MKKGTTEYTEGTEGRERERSEGETLMLGFGIVAEVDEKRTWRVENEEVNHGIHGRKRKRKFRGRNAHVGLWNRGRS